MARPEQPSDPTPTRIELALGPASFTDEGAGPPIVAIHGLPGSSRDFRWLAPALVARFRVIRVDLPGFGGTPWTTRPGYAPEDRAAFVTELLEALALPPALLVGHSMGGVVAAAAAEAAPDRVRALGFVSAPGLRLHRGLRRLPRRALSAWFAGERRGRITLPVLRRAFAMMGFRGPYPDEALVHTLHGVAALDLEVHARRLRALRTPSAVIWCADDPLIEPEIPEELARTVPDGPRLRFEAGGHNPQKHHATEIAEALAAWAAELGGGLRS